MCICVCGHLSVWDICLCGTSRLCVCVCAYACVWTSVCAYVCVDICLYACVWTSVCMRVCGHLSVYTCVWTSVCMRVCGHRSVMCVRATVHVSVCVMCVYACAWTCVSRACGHVRASVCHYNFEMLMCTIFILTIIVQFEMDIQYIIIWKVWYRVCAIAS